MGLGGVELVIAIEETFGITISDADAEGLVTPRILIDYVISAVGSAPKARPCLS